MRSEEINNGNRRINKLMGSTIKIHQEDVKDIPLAFLAIEDMKFHLSWKWLMPVVIKIEEDLEYPVVIKGKTCTIKADDENIFERSEDSKMLAVWKTIVEFLEWEQG